MKFLVNQYHKYWKPFWYYSNNREDKCKELMSNNN